MDQIIYLNNSNNNYVSKIRGAFFTSADIKVKMISKKIGMGKLSGTDHFSTNGRMEWCLLFIIICCVNNNN